MEHAVFIALSAGCDQQPAPGALLGLNETIFSQNTIEAINPNAPLDGSDTSPALSTTAVAGIVVGAFVVLLLAAGCIFMQIRKRKNRAKRAHRSSLSFRCMTQLPSPPHTPGRV